MYSTVEQAVTCAIIMVVCYFPTVNPTGIWLTSCPWRRHDNIFSLMIGKIKDKAGTVWLMWLVVFLVLYIIIIAQALSTSAADHFAEDVKCIWGAASQ